MDPEDEIEGFRVVVESLKNLGVKYIFGVVGIPVVEIGVAAQQIGIQYVGMRNEQAACYAAQAIGYLTGWPAACLAVSGPGVLHCIAGLANAKENCWPMILIGGSSETRQEGVGAFQEWPQIESVRVSTKYCGRPAQVDLIPRQLERAVRTSVYGRPGPCYIDLPGDMLNMRVKYKDVYFNPLPPPPPKMLPEDRNMMEAIELLKSAKRPLIIIGKGAAYGRAEMELRALTRELNIPVLPTPMGKGVIPDDSDLVISAARSKVLEEADVVLLVGARLNWMLHFGTPPRWSSTVKVIQMDICAEEMHNSIHSSVALQGDIQVTTARLNILKGNFKFSNSSPWWIELRKKCRENGASTHELCMDETVPLNYYAAFNQFSQTIPDSTYIVSEGANTMDIGRTMLKNNLPRHRLDAGTFGTMGVGLGFAIATALYARDNDPGARVLCVEGDSAFGFSGMEIETIARYNLPIVIVIINNSGIYSGFDKELYSELVSDENICIASPPTSLLPGVQYEKMMDMVGMTGVTCSKPQEIKTAVKNALAVNRATIINIMINPMAGRKAQQHEWLTKSKL
ncbi:2-hydroxyacyl-CoA lyase 1 [Eurytemora carolleeae]|uniref:2-hydroxyacyl-CoA lyase 1 n=1 Tax=Eurytemora carolleeae TaxID=1294199 RepID=UPI000C76B0C3|nr:2-hydroxyacyl-CoA lyase 1 [Eurytemora carolleeae]XP_023322404.1 2-hydroxyacyl-CoA lyase 1 [Eurytemora carolleeae]|eukprot:XP_023322403.1 2-hydroxyacyl-CoA lyase 1-like [Eurytemora affinis]